MIFKIFLFRVFIKTYYTRFLAGGNLIIIAINFILLDPTHQKQEPIKSTTQTVIILSINLSTLTGWGFLKVNKEGMSISGCLLFSALDQLNSYSNTINNVWNKANLYLTKI